MSVDKVDHKLMMMYGERYGLYDAEYMRDDVMTIIAETLEQHLGIDAADPVIRAVMQRIDEEL